MKFPSSIFGGQFVMKNYYSLGLSVAFIAVLAMVPHNAFSKKSKRAWAKKLHKKRNHRGTQNVRNNGGF